MRVPVLESEVGGVAELGKRMERQPSRLLLLLVTAACTPAPNSPLEQVLLDETVMESGTLQEVGLRNMAVRACGGWVVVVGWCQR